MLVRMSNSIWNPSLTVFFSLASLCSSQTLIVCLFVCTTECNAMNDFEEYQCLRFTLHLSVSSPFWLQQTFLAVDVVEWHVVVIWSILRPFNVPTTAGLHILEWGCNIVNAVQMLFKKKQLLTRITIYLSDLETWEEPCHVLHTDCLKSENSHCTIWLFMRP